jgi:hypothetical protein
MSSKAYEKCAVIGTIDPQASISSTAKTTDVVDMGKWGQVMFVFMIGDAAADDIVAKVETCDSGGTNNADFKSADTLSAHATNNDNKQIVITVDANELAGGSTNADRYVRGSLTAATNTITGACLVLGLEPKHGPANDNDLSSVVEIEDDQD